MEVIEQQAGHFPDFTPKPLARAMCEFAMISQGDLVLEPSAGRGILANEAQSRGAVVKCVELNGNFSTELFEQGYHTLRCDFATLNPDAFGTLFDAVVMCPPSNVCVKHIQHATKFVYHGGFVVALVKDEWVEIEQWFSGLMDVWTLPQNFFMADGRPVSGAIIRMAMNTTKHVRVRPLELPSGDAVNWQGDHNQRFFQPK